MFNVLNHTNFNAPVTALNNANFGKILSAGDPRIMQLAPEDASDAGEADQATYEYLGVAPLGLDTAGRITKLSFWLVLCDGKTAISGHS